MKNKYFPDETIAFNDIYFVCYMIERVARHIHQPNCYVADRVGCDGLWHELSVASVNHSLNPEQVVNEWVESYRLEHGTTDVTQVDARFVRHVPTPLQMGKVYARLIMAVHKESEPMPDTILSVYHSPICSTIDNYNASAYYEPSYVIERAFYNNEF